MDLTHIDPLAMADVLKIFFRELPDPILTFDMYDKFMSLEGKSTTWYTATLRQLTDRFNV